MTGRIDRTTLIERVSVETDQDRKTTEMIVQATLTEIYKAIKQGESVSLRDFGTFYVRPERDSWVFRFNPSQRWRKLFGWSSTSKGKL